MKYPIGIQTFEKIRKDHYVYVDKTDLVYKLAHDGNMFFLSRPRRFGKSLLVSTLEAYFSGKKELFKGLKIESLEKEWKTYPVFHIDFSVGSFLNNGTLEESIEGYLSKWETDYGINRRFNDFGLRFADILNGVYSKTGTRCVVLIDEYDKPLLDVMASTVKVPQEGGVPISLEEYNRNILKGFYSTFKAADASLQFVLLTGVTKFSQVSVFSGFNQPDDISMSAQYEALCGITDNELLEYFHEPIEEMGLAYGLNFQQMVDLLRRKYDGYHFSKKMTGIYNPFSLLNALKKSDADDYWFRTGTPTYLVHLLNKSDENLNELTGKYYSTDQFIDYKANDEQPLPMIYQSGYLTIKGYKPRTNSFLLDFPNEEVERGFTAILANNYFKTKTDSRTIIIGLLDDLADGDVEAFITTLTAFFASIPYSMHLKKEKERFFHYTFYLLLRLASTYTTYTEKQQSHGRVDCVIETDKFIYIFEFKLDGTADEALKQIEDKGYATEYASDSRTLYKIGVNFDSETGTISDWKME